MTGSFERNKNDDENESSCAHMSYSDLANNAGVWIDGDMIFYFNQDACASIILADINLHDQIIIDVNMLNPVS